MLDSGTLARVRFPPPNSTDSLRASRTRHPKAPRVPTRQRSRSPRDKIRADMRLLAPLYARDPNLFRDRWRTARRRARAPDAASLVPGIANEFGLKVTAGAWLGTDAKTQRARSACRDRSRPQAFQYRRHRGRQRNGLSRRNRFSSATMKLDLTPEELAQPLRSQGQERRSELELERAAGIDQRRAADQDHPARQARDPGAGHDRRNLERLAGSPRACRRRSTSSPSTSCLTGKASPATPRSMRRSAAYNLLRQMYPGKRIVIAEFGWPSAGYNLKDAIPGRLEQATVLRDFVSRAEAFGIDYNIIEAIDQPWKTAEGSVGAYWGLFDSSRQSKFAWSGAVVEQDHWKNMTLAVLFGLLLSAPIIAMRRATFGQAMLLGDVGECRRRVVRDRVRVLEMALLRLGRGLRARPRHRAAHSARLHRARAHGRDRGHRVRPQAAPAVVRCAVDRAGRLSARKSRSIFRPIASRRKCSKPRSMRSRR